MQFSAPRAMRRTEAALTVSSPCSRDRPWFNLDPASVLRVVLRGFRSAATDPAPTAVAMPSFGWTLSDFEAAAVTTSGVASRCGDDR